MDSNCHAHTTGSTPSPSLAKLDPSSPFYLDSQDRPSDFITPIRLKLDNFDDWSHAIRVALSSCRKFGFLDGTITEIVPPCTQDDWVTIHCMLVSWLMNTIDAEVHSMLSNYDNAKSIWDDLHERFSVVNGSCIHQLKGDINRCEQSKIMHIAVYFSKLNVLWDVLDKHVPLISCQCGKCTCQVGRQHETRRANDRLHQFFLGLCSEYYAQLQSTLLSQDPLPSLNRAFQQISQEEWVRGITRITEEKPDVLGFAVRIDNKSKQRMDKAKRAVLICSHCHKSGHDIATCFDLHGTPDWYLEKYGNNKGKPNVPSTKLSAGRGRNGVRANATNPVNTHGSPFADSTTAPTAQPLPGFTTEQWATLTAAFGTSSPSSHRLHGKLGLDAGCSHHVTGDESCLLDIKVVSPCPVGLPDGQSVVATKEGAVQITDKIILQHVLFVPQLTCNLISISQLNDDLNCFVQFHSNVCVTQDLLSREVIGTGERRDRLYYLRQGLKVQAVSVDSSKSLELWNSRMGHPSEKIVKLLPFLNNSKGFLTKGCEVCHRAKHSRDSFPLSANKSTRIFELVHCDLWGPYDETSSCGARYFLTLVDDYSRAV
ncbi:uncharacterized protein LOC133780145 [Humulus lupulus]|uniref:uncharacterized protein LOC133780145 n=1 Tax=Humulus lupulus TaxID=3486 RepID=UPI002B417383|nr:uncharacterized protein LOC133780145 [Humulus lupulus]